MLVLHHHLLRRHPREQTFSNGQRRHYGGSADGEWRLVGTLTAASIEQQRNRAPLVPPHRPPTIATFLDVPYAEFKRRALSGLDERCVREPLRGTIARLLQAEALATAAPSGGGESAEVAISISAGVAVVATLGLLGAGCMCAALLNAVRRRRSDMPPPTKLVEISNIGSPPTEGRVA